MTKQNRNILRALLLLILATSCQVSRDLPLPEDAVPDHYRGELQKDSASIALISWEEYFADPALRDLIGHAIQRNNNLKVAWGNIEKAQWQLKQARWGNVPEIDIQISGTSSRFSDNSLNGLSTSTFLGRSHLEDFLIQGGISWEADIWGKIRNQKKEALARYLESIEAQRGLQTIIVAMVTKSYYNLMMLDAQLEVAQHNRLLSESTMKIIDLQYESGLVTSLAQQQAAAQLMQATQLVPMIEAEIVAEENTLSILTGNFPAAIERQRLPDTVSLPETFDLGVPADLVRERPDVKAAELELQAANASVGIAQAMMYPSLRITAATGLNAFEVEHWFNLPGSVFGMVGGSLIQPVVNRRRLKSNFESAKITREQIIYQFRETVLTAVKEVSDALTQARKAEERQRIVRRRAAALEEAVSNANMLFENGVASYLEVITAQSNLLQSQLDLALVKRSQLEATVDLYRALGGGWR